MIAPLSNMSAFKKLLKTYEQKIYDKEKIYSELVTKGMSDLAKDKWNELAMMRRQVKQICSYRIKQLKAA